MPHLNDETLRSELQKTFSVFDREVTYYELKTICGYTAKQINRAEALGIIAYAHDGYVLREKHDTD